MRVQLAISHSVVRARQASRADVGAGAGVDCDAYWKFVLLTFVEARTASRAYCWTGGLIGECRQSLQSRLSMPGKRRVQEGCGERFCHVRRLQKSQFYSTNGCPFHQGNYDNFLD